MIQINENYRIIRLDKTCLQLEKRKDVVSKKDGSIKKEWVADGYYPNLKWALSGLIKKYSVELVKEDFDNVTQVIERLDTLENNIISVLEGDYEL
jgi:hypothetical protein